MFYGSRAGVNKKLTLLFEINSKQQNNTQQTSLKKILTFTLTSFICYQPQQSKFESNRYCKPYLFIYLATPSLASREISTTTATKCAKVFQSPFLVELYKRAFVNFVKADGEYIKTTS